MKFLMFVQGDRFNTSAFKVVGGQRGGGSEKGPQAYWLFQWKALRKSKMVSGSRWRSSKRKMQESLQGEKEGHLHFAIKTGVLGVLGELSCKFSLLGKNEMQGAEQCAF